MNIQIVKNMNRLYSALRRCLGVAALFVIPYPALASADISFFYLRGDAEGYLQTPAGGQPGSTTRQRPTLKELGLDSPSIYDFSISRVVGDGKHKLLGGYQVIRADSTASLKRDLTSQNKNFSAGDVVKADLQADWLRFNWLYEWRTTEVAGKSFVVSPGAGLVFFDFHYQLDKGDLKADRAYSKLGYRIGTQLDWRLADKFTLQLDVFEGLPFPNTPVILSAGLKGKYTLWDKGSVGSLVAGVVYNRIDYEDEQTVPNHIRIETGPLLEAGLTVNFQKMLPVFRGGIDALTYVGSGHYRRVYVHPYDDSKCIKIMCDEHKGKSRERKYRITSQREHDYYDFLAGRGVVYDHISGYHGRMWIQHKDHAQLAGVFDLIRNDSGEVSKTLDLEFHSANSDELANAMHELYEYLLRYKIISGFKMKNIVVQQSRQAPPKCILIDNIGNSDFIPICNYVDWFANRKIRRRWLGFLESALAKDADNSAVKVALQKAGKALSAG